ncbi:MAG: tRNA preQ1(34) S-adenosylmethionine ribosyltransferase-isomerase QueA [Alphaproteobacteria bacterium]|nr:tRNA preQ1(34) S-adenosylmethionine ribosyltransferase-isomerase QueA [Alphaproteobacteria bacterium]
MRVSEFDFELPEELIALRPAQPRDNARMLVVREDGTVGHAHVRDLTRWLRAGDALVLNDTRVIPARLFGRREGRGATAPRIEVLLFRREAPDLFRALARPARKLHTGDALSFGSLAAVVAGRGEAGEVTLRFQLSGPALDRAIAETGTVPLPPYIASKRAADTRDVADYQTIFAKHAGSAAAPTAGLHFTPELLARLAAAGVERQMVTLHVGPGTFLPVAAEETSAHRMHAEQARLDGETARALDQLRRAGGRIAAVGTTSLRTLESAAREDGTLGPFEGETSLFIVPGYRFRAVDILLTNFHLPRSTLFMLVAAFAGLDVMRRAYAEAITARYRFYSYGDACLLFRPR